MRLLVLLVLLIGIAFPASAQPAGVSRPIEAVAAGPQHTSRIEVELVAMSQWAAPGSTAIVALRQKIQPGWHTYWRNPGDSGGPTSLSWRLPTGVVAGDILWPLPNRQRLADLVNLGYEGRVLLPVPIEIPAGARAGSTLPLIAEATLFVCSDEMCVPETLTVRLDLPIREGAAPLTARYGSDIQRLVEIAPRPAGITARFSRTGDRVVLSATGGPLSGANLSQATFFPFDAGRVSHGPALSGEAGVDGLTLTLSATDTASAEPLRGVLATDAGAWEITAEPGVALAGTTGRRLAVEDAAGAAPSAAGLARAVLFAFLGGLILNLMPCVFPVLALKAAALSRSAREPSQARIDGLAYAAGVMISFALLGGGMLALRALGQEIGWGFQLQSPMVVAVLALVMLAVGLNLLGVFEIGGRLQAVGASKSARLPGVAGAFFTGVLAVVVAAPCTAPFMAVALGAALVAPWPVAMAIFLALGAGLALPYLAISLSPALLSRLPKPGAWMVTLQRVLSVPMFGAGLWLLWVFQRQQGWLALAVLVAGLAFAGAAVWVFGQAQRRRFEARPSRMLRFGALAGVGAATACLIVAGSLPAATQSASSQSAIPSASWSPEAVRAAQAQGRPVLVDFTADWCVSCKINERTALATGETREAVERTRAVYLVADWTRRDPAIARELAAHGRSGVPLYLVYGPGDAEPRILPQLLTSGVVVEALEDAAR